MEQAVRVWDVRQAQPVASLVPNAASQARDCWTVAFGGSYNDDERCVCAGYDNGDIKLLDLRVNKVRWETNIKVKRWYSFNLHAGPYDVVHRRTASCRCNSTGPTFR